jgi:calpain-15
MYSWLGDWSENSSKWTAELRKQVGGGKTVNDHGLFWMSFADFTKYFSSIDICKTRLDLFENRIPGYFYYDGCNEMYAYNLIVFDTSEFDIGLFHKFNKNRRENSELDLSFVVLKKNKQKKDLIEGVEVATKRYVRKFMGCEHIFEAGEYLIVPMSFNFWTKPSSSKKARSKYDLQQQLQKKNINPFNNLYNLVVHSTKEFYLEQKIYSKSLLADTLIQLCLSKGERIPSGLKSACIYQLTNYWSGILFVAENYDKKQYLHVELDLERSKNVTSTRESFITKDSVPPLSRQVLNVITHLEGVKDFSIHYKVKYRLSINPNLIVWPGMSSRTKMKRNHPDLVMEPSNVHAPRSVFY